MARKLTPKQELFVQEYLIDLNATQAAIRAGYSVKNADKIGPELLGKTRIAAAIREAMAERSRRTGITADRVLEEIAKIAFLNPNDVVDLDEGKVKATAKKEDIAAIAGVKVKTIPTKSGKGVEREIKFNDKIRALELLGKHLGMFTDKVELGGSVETKQTLDLSKLSDEQLDALLQKVMNNANTK